MRNETVLCDYCGQIISTEGTTRLGYTLEIVPPLATLATNYPEFESLDFHEGCVRQMWATAGAPKTVRT